MHQPITNHFMVCDLFDARPSTESMLCFLEGCLFWIESKRKPNHRNLMLISRIWTITSITSWLTIDVSMVIKSIFVMNFWTFINRTCTLVGVVWLEVVLGVGVRERAIGVGVGVGVVWTSIDIKLCALFNDSVAYYNEGGYAVYIYIYIYVLLMPFSVLIISGMHVYFANPCLEWVLHTDVSCLVATSRWQLLYA